MHEVKRVVKKNSRAQGGDAVGVIQEALCDDNSGIKEQVTGSSERDLACGYER